MERMYDQMNKLASKLDEYKIPYYREYDTVLNHDHICYPDHGENRVCSIIFGKGTYGYERGRLEIMGLLTPEEEEWDDVVGYLTADDVFERIKNHWELNKERK